MVTKVNGKMLKVAQTNALAGNAVFATFASIATSVSKDGAISESTLTAMNTAGTRFSTEVHNTTSNTGGWNKEGVVLTTAQKDAQGYAGTEGYACIQFGTTGYWGCLKADKFDVRMFGAILDGVANDSPYFNAAGSLAGDEPVFVPECTVELTDAVSGLFYSSGVVNTLTNYIDIINVRQSATGKIKLPSQFDWFTYDIFLENDGYARSTIRKENFLPTITKTYYLDWLNGNDANDGLTVSTPLRNLNVAMQKADVDEIVIIPEYTDRTFCCHGDITITRDILIRPLSGVAKLLGADIDATWIAGWAVDGTYSNTYTQARTNVVSVLDKKYKTLERSYEIFTTLQKVASAALVNTTPNSWYSDGVSVWIRLIDDRVPDADVLVNLDTTINVLSPTANTVYFKDVYFIGIGNVLMSSDTDGQLVTWVGDNVAYAYARGPAGGFEPVGGKCFHFNSAAYENLYDGFNYHKSDVNTNSIYAYEENCVGFRDGGTGVGNNNGSTMHDGGSIIRLNCEYWKNEGPNVADVHSSTSSLNVNVSFHDSDKSTSKRNYDCLDGCDAWLIGCSSYGASDFDFVVDPAAGNGTLHLFKTPYSLFSGNSANVKNFYPF